MIRYKGFACERSHGVVQTLECLAPKWSRIHCRRVFWMLFCHCLTEFCQRVPYELARKFVERARALTLAQSTHTHTRTPEQLASMVRLNRPRLDLVRFRFGSVVWLLLLAVGAISENFVICVI